MEDRKFPLLESILEEAAQAPIFHFSPIHRFLKIIKSNTLKASRERMGKASLEFGGNFIAFTRNPDRTFIPGDFGAGIGFRFDREKLRQKFGKKLGAFAKNPLRLEELPERDREKVLQARKTGDFSKVRGLSVSVGGSGVTDLEALARGKDLLRSKFESEERLLQVEKVDNLKQFVTGIIIPTNRIPVVKKGDATAVAISLIWLSGALGRDRGARIRAFDVRKDVLDAVKKFNVPIVFGRREFSIGQVIREMKKLFELKKAKDPELEKVLDKYIGKNRSRLTFNLSGLRERSREKMSAKFGKNKFTPGRRNF